jgi:hypothetical protein
VTTESFRAIVVPDAGLPSLTYVLSGFDYFELASVSADIDAGGAGADVTVTLELGDATGRTFTKNATGAKIAQFSRRSHVRAVPARHEHASRPAVNADPCRPGRRSSFRRPVTWCGSSRTMPARA